MSSRKSKVQLNFVVGTAAELIKIYPLIFLALKRDARVRVVSTGQARENFHAQFKDFHLEKELLFSPVTSEGDLDRGGKAVKWFLRALTQKKNHLKDNFLTGEKSLAIVHGDTLSTLVGALWAYRLELRLAHVEAGLRSTRLFDPFPEELTRRLVSRFADLHFAPHAAAAENLRRQGVTGTVVETHANTLRDAVMIAPANELKTPPPPYALVNVHRFENLNSEERWQKLVATTLKAAAKIKIIFVCHPQTRRRLELDEGARTAFREAGVVLRDRMSFSNFLALLKGAEFLISDGGSNQEECSYLAKPCLLMRATTERTEGLEASCLLSEFADEKIDAFLNDWRRYRTSSPTTEISPSKIILDTLCNSD